MAYVGKRISYLRLSELLYGLWEFSAVSSEEEGRHARVMVFEIDVDGQGRVGFGTVLVRSIGGSSVSVGDGDRGGGGGGGGGGMVGGGEDAAAGNGIKNDTALSLLSTAAAAAAATNNTDDDNATISSSSSSSPFLVPPFPVPSSTVTLYFQHFGSTIPLPNLAGALTNALRRIRRDVLSRSHEPIPNGGWNYRDQGSYVGIRVVSEDWHGEFVSWQVLSWALGGLLEYVEGGEGQNARAWGFEIDVHDVGRVGRGVVGYFPMRGGSV